MEHSAPSIDKKRLIVLFTASAVFSLMISLIIWALFLRDFEFGMRKPDVAPDLNVEQQQPVWEDDIDLSMPAESKPGEATGEDNTEDKAETTNGKKALETTPAIVDTPKDSASKKSGSEKTTKPEPAKVTTPKPSTHSAQQKPVTPKPVAPVQQAKPTSVTPPTPPTPPVPPAEPLAAPVPPAG